MRAIGSSIAALACLVASGCGAGDSSDPIDPPRAEAPKVELDAQRITVNDRIEAWNAELRPSDRHAKYCKMAASPFAFFRGVNHLYWAAAWSEARLAEYSGPETVTWIQGDLHVQNFGAFENDDGDVVYDLNDFDEAVIVDYTLDLWRVAASVVLVARENNNLSAGETAAVIETFVTNYVAAMSSYALDDSENQRVFTTAELEDPLKAFLEDVEARNDRVEALDDWTTIASGSRAFDTELAELEPLTAAEEAAIIAAVPDYGDSLSGGLVFDPAYFAVKSVARRLLAGTGSLGTPRYYLLVEGESPDEDDDRILDVKMQGLPTPLHFNDEAREMYEQQFVNHATRHARGYKALADDVDDHLGVMMLAEGEFSVRERSVFKKSLDTSALEPSEYAIVAAAWGLILATAHARADHDAELIPHSVDQAIANAVGADQARFAAIVGELALELADATERDWERFTAELAPVACP